MMNCSNIALTFKRSTKTVAENKSLKELVTDLYVKFEKLELEVAEMKKQKNTNTKNVALEKQVYENQQYSRRDTLEIVGLDMSIADNDLEKEVTKVLDDIGVTVRPDQIQACHRLYDKKRTIIKFVNRKTAIESLSKRKELAAIPEYHKKVYINESLCGHYRFLYAKCKELWKSGRIFGFWIANGTLRYRVNEHGDAVKINHIEDLVNVFGEFAD